MARDCTAKCERCLETGHMYSVVVFKKFKYIDRTGIALIQTGCNNDWGKRVTLVFYVSFKVMCFCCPQKLWGFFQVISKYSHLRCSSDTWGHTTSPAKAALHSGWPDPSESLIMGNFVPMIYYRGDIGSYHGWNTQAMLLMVTKIWL